MRVIALCVFFFFFKETNVALIIILATKEMKIQFNPIDKNIIISFRGATEFSRVVVSHSTYSIKSTSRSRHSLIFVHPWRTCTFIREVAVYIYIQTHKHTNAHANEPGNSRRRRLSRTTHRETADYVVSLLVWPWKARPHAEKGEGGLSCWWWWWGSSFSFIDARRQSPSRFIYVYTCIMPPLLQGESAEMRLRRGEMLAG